MTDIIEIPQQENDVKMVSTLQAYLYGINLLQCRGVFQSVFQEMEATWLSLYTKEKTCPIVEQTGTFVKRKLVKQYAATLVKTLQGIDECTFIPKLKAKAEEFWTADEVVTQIADTPTKDHADLFRALLCQIYGVSEVVHRLLMDKDVTWLEVYQSVVQIFPTINLSPEVDLDAEANPETLIHGMSMYLFNRNDIHHLIFI